MRTLFKCASLAALAWSGWKLQGWLNRVDLRGEVVLITGGSRGLGLLMAREFGRRGCRVAICARDDAELRAAREQLNSWGVDALAIVCDVSQPKDIERTIQAVAEHYGSIDILVNNAGVIQVGPWQSASLDDFVEAMDIMYWGMLHASRAALPGMIERGRGRIVNITSIGGMVSLPHLVPYCAAKFAAFGLSQGMHAELKPLGIDVTTIVPGIMRLGSHLHAKFQGRRQAEFAWFSLGASLPGVSLSGDRAARQIVQAVEERRSLRILGLPAQIVARLHGLAPATGAAALALVQRCLPSSPESRRPALKGKLVQEQIDSPLFHAATALGQRAAERNNE